MRDSPIRQIMLLRHDYVHRIGRKVAMLLRIWRFAAIYLTAPTLSLTFCHLLEMPRCRRTGLTYGDNGSAVMLHLWQSTCSVSAPSCWPLSLTHQGVPSMQAQRVNLAGTIPHKRLRESGLGRWILPNQV